MSAVHFRTNLVFDALLAGRGGNGDAPISNCKAPSSEGDTGPSALVAEQELPLGSHLVTPRRGYVPHGIYVGDGNVVHYADSRTACAEGRWKKFLSLVSPTAVLSA